MRTVSAPFDEALFNQATTFARLWRITRADGVVLSLTDSVNDVNLSGEIFRADMGFNASAVHTSSLSVQGQSCEVDVSLLDNGISETDIRARRYEDARAIMMIVDYSDPTMGVLAMFRGRFGRVKVTDKSHATVEIISFVGKNSPLAARQYSQSCAFSFGDADCTFPIESVRADFTITAVVDPLTVQVTWLNGQVADYFAFGQMIFDTGANKGNAIDIQASSPSPPTLGLFYRPNTPLAVGDAAHAYPGCNLQLLTCRDKFSNVRNFGGQPFNPQWTVTS